MKMTVYAYVSKEDEDRDKKAKELGLSESAVNYLRYFEEVELEIEVEKSTGTVKTAKVVGPYQAKSLIDITVLKNFIDLELYEKIKEQLL